MTGFNSKRQMAADKLQEPYDQTALELCNVCGWKTLIPDDGCLNCERAQPAQEPTGMLHIDRLGQWLDASLKERKRPWVGLTDDELADIWYKESLDWMEFARAHEAALKEKNT